MIKNYKRQVFFIFCMVNFIWGAGSSGAVQVRKVNKSSVKEYIGNVETLVQDSIKTTLAETTSETYIDRLPVRDVFDISALSAGYARGTFRGSRPEEGGVVYIVDGVPVNNPIGSARTGGSSGAGSNGLATEIPLLSVESMEVVRNGWDAEYGNANSAVIKITTKKGSRRKFHGEVRVDSDPTYVIGESEFYAPAWVMVYGGPNPEYDPDTNPPGAKPGGQIFGDGNLINWRRTFPESRNIEWELNGPEPFFTKVLKNMLPGYLTYSLSGHYKHNQSANRNNRGPDFGHSVLLNLDYVPSSSLNFNFSGLHQNRQYYPYSINRDYYLTTGELFGYKDSGTPVYVPNAIDIDGNEVPVTNHYMIYNSPAIRDYSSKYQLSMVHKVNPETEYKVILSRFSTGEGYETKDPVSGEILPYEDNGMIGFDAFRFKIPGTAIEGNSFTSNPLAMTRSRKHADQVRWMIKSDLTARMDKNSFKAGFEVNFYDLEYNYYGVATGGNDYNSEYERNPFSAALYIQDRFKHKKLIADFGLRLDYLDPHSIYSGVIFTGEGGSAVDTDYEVGDEKRVRDSRETKFKAVLSPRFRFSYFPDEKNTFRFFFGRFNKFPQFDKYYLNYTMDLRGAFKYIGNARLSAEKTILFEAGWNHRFDKSSGIDITVFYKDISDLVQTKEARDEYGQNFYMYINDDRANVRGMEFSFEKKTDNGITGELNYTLMQAVGRHSVPTQVFTTLYNSRPPITNVTNLDWDQRHRITGWLSYKTPDRHFLGGWLMTLMYQFNSGTPYTSPSRSAYRISNDRTYPSWDRWDMRIRKEFSLYKDLKVSFYGDIYNLFDGRDRVTHVNTEEFLRSGDPTAGGKFYEWIWQAPRSMKMGMSLKF